MNNLYINLAELLYILEELDNNPDTWYYYSQLEKILNTIEQGYSVDIKEVTELTILAQQVIVRCKGDVQKSKEVVQNILDVLHSVSE